LQQAIHLQIDDTVNVDLIDSIQLPGSLSRVLSRSKATALAEPFPGRVVGAPPRHLPSLAFQLGAAFSALRNGWLSASPLEGGLPPITDDTHFSCCKLQRSPRGEPKKRQ
jgi:hypothetical protein